MLIIIYDEKLEKRNYFIPIHDWLHKFYVIYQQTYQVFDLFQNLVVKIIETKLVVKIFEHNANKNICPLVKIKSV